MSNDTETLTLTDFLLARIAEDEAYYSETAGTPEFQEWARTKSGDYNDGWIVEQALRMLRECEAKRQIVEQAACVLEAWSAQHGGPGRPLWEDVTRRERSHARSLLDSLAVVYADHPDYREDWR